MAFHHVSVMPEEVLDGLLTDPDGIYVDCTLGGAGHAGRLAEKLSAKGWLIGIDQDAEAIKAAQAHLDSLSLRCRVSVVHSNFSKLDEIFARLAVPKITGILFDLGVSSYQIDTAARGFSYMQDAPLDMRMDAEGKQTAADVVNTYSAADLDRIFHDYGEERWGRRIAETTGELVDTIERAIPKAVRRAQTGHPAKRVFQALRIEVNDELGILDAAFHRAVDQLTPSGRIAIITFHSLEDRIAKKALRQMAAGCICPPELPVCVCHNEKKLRLLGKVRKAGKAELAANTRAKSAKLRLAERL